jgi:hypothetical protein
VNAVMKGSAFFWDITHRRTVILYGRFGTAYLSHIQGPRSPKSRKPMLRRIVILYRRFGTEYRSHLQASRSPRRCVIPQKGADLINIAAEASNHGNEAICFKKCEECTDYIGDHQLLMEQCGPRGY